MTSGCWLISFFLALLSFTLRSFFFSSDIFLHLLRAMSERIRLQLKARLAVFPLNHSSLYADSNIHLNPLYGAPVFSDSVIPLRNTPLTMAAWLTLS